MNKFSVTGILLLLTLLFTAPIIAMSDPITQEAVHFIDTNTKRVLDIKNTYKDEAQSNELRQMFDKMIDVKWLSGFSLGKYWHQISDEEKKTYRRAYSDYIFSSYLRKFNDFTTTSYKVIGGKRGNNKYYIVHMEVMSSEQKAIDVVFRLKKVNGSFKVRDIVVEGISNAQAQRSEFSTIISEKGIDKLIEMLKEKT